ncbi:hypothetical protein ACF05W_33795 [Streptomyces lydicus]|uniref:hypothetical protein n=1 Tax=Streptomyces lydicus TaxID=47763 RepID=UPI0036FDAE50
MIPPSPVLLDGCFAGDRGLAGEGFAADDVRLDRDYRGTQVIDVAQAGIGA